MLHGKIKYLFVAVALSIFIIIFVRMKQEISWPTIE